MSFCEIKIQFSKSFFGIIIVKAAGVLYLQTKKEKI